MSKAAPRKPAVKVKTNLTTEVAHELPLKIESEKIYSRLGPDLRPLSFVKYRAILKAASQMFLSQGYGPTSMDAVAEAAGVSKRTVYGHFDTKYALFSAGHSGSLCKYSTAVAGRVSDRRVIRCRRA